MFSLSRHRVSVFCAALLILINYQFIKYSMSEFLGYCPIKGQTPNKLMIWIINIKIRCGRRRISVLLLQLPWQRLHQLADRMPLE